MRIGKVILRRKLVLYRRGNRHSLPRQTLAPYVTSCAAVYTLRMVFAIQQLVKTMEARNSRGKPFLVYEPILREQCDYCLDRIDPELWRY